MLLSFVNLSVRMSYHYESLSQAPEKANCKYKQIVILFHEFMNDINNEQKNNAFPTITGSDNL